MPAKTANAWAGHSQQPSTPTRYESSSVPALANPQSPADYILEELPCAASWRQTKPKSGRPNELTHPSRKLTLFLCSRNDRTLRLVARSPAGNASQRARSGGRPGRFGHQHSFLRIPFLTADQRPMVVFHKDQLTQDGVKLHGNEVARFDLLGGE